MSFLSLYQLEIIKNKGSSVQIAQDNLFEMFTSPSFFDLPEYSSQFLLFHHRFYPIDSSLKKVSYRK